MNQVFIKKGLPIDSSQLVEGQYLKVQGHKVVSSPISTPDLSGYVPYTGATGPVDLGAQNIKTTHVPAANPDLVNKLYIDDNYYTSDEVNELIAGAEFSFRLTNTASDIGGYYLLSDVPTGEAEATIVTAVSSDATLIKAFATATDQPDFTTLSEGVYQLHIHASATTLGKKTARIYAELYKRTSGGTETLLGTTEQSLELTSLELQYDLHLTVLEETQLAGTDRLVVKVYANIESATGDNPDVTISFEGDTDSRFSVRTTLTAFDERYLKITDAATTYVPYTGANQAVYLTDQMVYFSTGGIGFDTATTILPLESGERLRIATNDATRLDIGGTIGAPDIGVQFNLNTFQYWGYEGTGNTALGLEIGAINGWNASAVPFRIWADDQKLSALFSVGRTGNVAVLGDLTVADEAYGAGWDNSLEVPTKNAVYDKIQTLSGGTPGGSDTQVQFNDGGAFGGDAGLVYNKTTNTLSLVSGHINVPGAGADSQHIGANSTAAGQYAVAIGYQSSADVYGGIAVGLNAVADTTQNGIAIGNGAISGAQNAVAMGTSCNASGVNGFAWGQLAIASGVSAIAIGGDVQATNSSAIAIGPGARTAGNTGVAVGSAASAASTWGVAIGNTATVGSTHLGSVAIGLLSTTTAANQFVSGDTNSPKTNVFFGAGVIQASASSYPWTLNGTGGSGTDVAGGALNLAGGKATGNAVGGSVKIQTSTAGVSGITLQTLATVIEAAAGSKLGFFNTAAAVQQAHIVDADGTLADLTTKFNSLLAKLETYGLLAAA